MDNLTFDNLTEPYSLESEQAVLGSVLIDPQCLSDVMTVLKAEHFYIPQHRDIYSVIVTLDALGSKIDPLIVLEELKRTKFITMPTAKLPGTACSGSTVNGKRYELCQNR